MVEKKGKKAYINTNIDEELLSKLKVLAAKEGKCLNDLLKEAIDNPSINTSR